MNLVDASVLTALRTDEPTSRLLREALDREPRPRVSAATLVEAHVVALGRYGPDGSDELRRLVEDLIGHRDMATI